MTKKPVRTKGRIRSIALITGGILLAADVAVYALVVRPRIAEYNDLAGTRERFTRDLANAEKTQKTLDAYVERLNSTKTNATDFLQKVLRTKQENLVDVQREINEIGREFRIDPDTVSYGSTELAEDGLERFNISVLLEGDYTDLRKFIARVENSEKFLVIESVTLQGTKEGGLLLSMNIVISTYFDAPWLKDTKKGAARGRRRT